MRVIQEKEGGEKGKERMRKNLDGRTRRCDI